MAKLTSEQKRFLVERLACYDTPSEAAAAFEDTFGQKIERGHVTYYDAGRLAVRSKLAPTLVALFDAVRARFVSDTSDIAVAQKSFRLRQLDRVVREERSPLLRMQALEQAAKEANDGYGKQRIEHGGGVTIRVVRDDPGGGEGANA